MTTYDEIPYDSHAFPGTHPDQMAIMGHVFGLRPMPVDQCRVLEIGCAAGGNLIPMANALPQSSFVGIDLSSRQINDGLQVIKALDLSNISLKAMDVLDVDDDLGLFDYIICHGVYSWVPPAVQEKILRVCSENLVQGGIAYVSYNTLPGWHLRGAVRDMMQFHAARFDAPASRIEQSRALLNFLIDAVPADGSAYSQLLHDELEIIQNRADNYLFHEHLEDVNEPLYFHQFVSRAADAGLRFLAESHLSQMVPNQFAPNVSATLVEISHDLTHMEQYLDFLRNRMFRCSLLCHAGVEPDRTVNRERLLGCYAAGALRPEGDSKAFAVAPSLVFVHPTESRITVTEALQQAALWHLGQRWPARLHVDELAVLARGTLGGESSADDIAGVADILLECLSGDLVEIRLSPARYLLTISAQPLTSSLVRHMAASGHSVTNLRHESVYLNSISRQTLLLLDGHRTHDDIADALSAVVMRGDMTVEQAGEPVTEPDKVRATVAEALPMVLEELAARALLVA